MLSFRRSLPRYFDYNQLVTSIYSQTVPLPLDCLRCPFGVGCRESPSGGSRLTLRPPSPNTVFTLSTPSKIQRRVSGDGQELGIFNNTSSTLFRTSHVHLPEMFPTSYVQSLRQTHESNIGGDPFTTKHCSQTTYESSTYNSLLHTHKEILQY